MGTDTSIALNVSRARLTVIGFMLMIDIFSLGIFVGDLDQYISLGILTDVSMFYGFVSSLCVGTLAATLMLISERFDPLGNSDVGIFAFAEMTMFVALAQSLGGILHGFITLFNANLGAGAVAALQVAADKPDLVAAGGIFSGFISWMVALTWAFMVYVAPLWSASRLPTTTTHKRIYVGYYFLLTCLVFALFAYALHIEFLFKGESPGFLNLFMRSFWAPGLWGETGSAS